MPRYLTGIQSSGKAHLGNLLGAILPAIARAKASPEPAFYFIADLHTLTSSREAATNRANTLSVAATWLACGLDTQKEYFYRQSDVPEVCELAWYLGCFTPYPMLANSHSFKDKSENLALVSAGLFTYPVLMAADILLYDAEKVPVGKDQQQHLEITRDIATAFNHQTGQEVFVLPEADFEAHVMTLPGTDGRKMSKSYGNTLNVLQDEKALRKQVMSIVTDSTPKEAPKDPATDTVFALFSAVAEPHETEELATRYRAGGMGYGDAKQWLYEVLVRRFSETYRRYTDLQADTETLERELLLGAERARNVGSQTLARVRSALGFRV
ncbi:MAG: tryptophan--tRNA ligase [Bacteroidia bacterium]|nr:tryptophan--tRNA ligase [Bacteroidia bacterium]